MQTPHKKLLRVLVVDDDADILDLLKYNLEKENFKVKTLENSAKTISVARSFCPDLIILDIMMPQLNGIELCKKLRSIKRFKETYIFFLTAKSENYYQQAALNTGGDDYIEKIIGLRSLIYKVNSVLKQRFTIRKSVTELKIGTLKIIRELSAVYIHDRLIKLSKPEFDLLFFFAQNPNKLISAKNLIHNIWGSEIYLFESSIDVYINNLKNKIGLAMIKSLEDNQYRFIVY